MDRSQHGMIFLRILFIATATLIFASCGAEQTAVPRTEDPGNPTIVTCDDIMKTHDQDADGIYDYDEVYGKPNATGALVFTDPVKADTDGDGRSDKDEFSTKQIDMSTEEVPTAIQMNAIQKDFLIRVYAKGSNDSAAPTTPTTGWNFFQHLKLAAGEQIKLEEVSAAVRSTTDATYGLWSVGIPDASLSLSTFIGSLGYPSWLLGPSKNWPATLCTTGNICLMGKPRGELIGRWATSATDTTHEPIQIGSVMSAGTWQLAAPSADLYLELRANDRDKDKESDSSPTALNDNDGFVVLRATITKTDGSALYPQRAPTAAEIAALHTTLCPGIQ